VKVCLCILKDLRSNGGAVLATPIIRFTLDLDLLNVVHSNSPESERLGQ
jgi:hypothetical protein